MSPAVAEFAPGAGALPKQTSKGLRDLAEWLDRWTDFEWEKHGYEAGGSGKRLPCCSSAGGVSLCLWGVSAEKPFFPCIYFLVSRIHVAGKQSKSTDMEKSQELLP